jgi:hypothetical protein
MGRDHRESPDRAWLGYILLGVYLAVMAWAGFKWITDRFDRVERAARDKGTTSTIGVVPGPFSEEAMRERRRASTREFAEDLRAEGLVLAEAAKGE